MRLSFGSVIHTAISEVAPRKMRLHVLMTSINGVAATFGTMHWRFQVVPSP